MADTAITSFLTALQNIRGAGKFCAHGSTPFVPPGIVFKNDDELALPLCAAQAAELRALAEPAPYGMGAETRLDESVRKCWQIDAGELRWTSKKWSQSLAALVKKIAGELGVEGKVSAEPYKLLLYDQGGFFLPHRDTEKVPGMFGSLILCLPSRHSGGALVLRHQGREVRVELGAEFDPAEFRWAAFYADCEHEVLPVTSGRRLCLAFNLVLTQGNGRPPAAPKSGEEALLTGMQHIARTQGDDLTAILLEHRYTKEGLSVAALKGDDRARATALFAMAERAGLTARLALVSLHQMGELEEDVYDSRRHGRSRKGADEDGSMGEIYDESLTIEHWRTPEDKQDPLGSFSISEDNILSLAELDEGAPDEKYAEGFTGNAGCTMEHWYRRAAIVVWPQDATPALLARYDFDAACQSFSSTATTGGKEAITLCQALLREGAIRLGDADEWTSEHLGMRMGPLLGGISRLGDEALYEKIAQSIFIPVFKNASRDTWAALLSGFAGRPLEFLLRHTPSGPITSHNRACFTALDATLGQAPELLPRFAELLSRLAGGQAAPARSYDQGAERRISTPSYQAHLALAASCVVVQDADRKVIKSWLWNEGGLRHVREVLAPALLEKTHRDWFKKEHSLAPGLLTATIQVLAAETAQTLLPYPDWRRPVPLIETGVPQPAYPVWGQAGVTLKALIHDLLHFMTDPDAQRHEIRRIQSDRRHVEEYVKRHQLDLDLTTVRKGSPHTLVCCKNDQSYRRACKQRTTDETLLAALRQCAVDEAEA